MCSILGANFEPMAQKVIPDKEQKEKEQIRKKEYSPLIQVDKKFREAKGLIDWNRLFRGKPTEQQKQTSEPESIIGATKTLIRSDFKNEEKNQAIQTYKKPALKMDNTIITQQSRPKSKKPKLGL